MFRRTIRLACVGAAAAAVAIGASAVPAAAAPSHSRTVLPGQSIQEALDAVSNGGRVTVMPGVYHENLLITKNNITLKAYGARLEPPEEPQVTPCDSGPPEDDEGSAAATLTAEAEAAPVSGICVIGTRPEQPVRGVDIRGIDIRNFGLNGVIVLFAHNTSVVDGTFIDNHEYGLAAFESKGTRFANNRVEGSEDAGIYIGDSERANARVTGNEVAGNNLGIFLRNSQHGTVRDNNVHDNCAGILVLADAPGPAGAYRVSQNLVTHNNRVCTDPEDPESKISGSGIVLLGAHDMDIHRNIVNENVPGDPGASPFAGGIVVVSGFGGTEPASNRITRNTAFENYFDILWDGSGTNNVLSHNSCAFSVPSGFCSL